MCRFSNGNHNYTTTNEVRAVAHDLVFLIFLYSQVKDYLVTTKAGYIPLQRKCQPKAEINPKTTGRNAL